MGESLLCVGRARVVVVVAAVVVAGFLVAAVSGGAQDGPLLSPAWVPDGADGVDAMVAAGGSVYLGGDFSQLGQPFGAFAVYRRGQGVPEAAVVRFRDGGEVSALTGDGAGGWYVGGVFGSFGGVACGNLVHVLASGRVDARWCPKPTQVLALLRRGRVLYVVCDRLRGSLSARLLRFDTRSGRPLPWPVKLGESATIYPPNVWALAATPRLVYLGGGFASVDGRQAKRLAAVDPGSGRLIWGARVDGGRVERLLVARGRLFALGGFDRVNGQARAGFAALDATTGRLLDWHPQVRIPRFADAVVSAHALYLGRWTTRQAASGLIALDPVTGKLLWRRRQAAWPVALLGHELLVSSRGGLRALDALTGAADPWKLSNDGGRAVAGTGTVNFNATTVAVSGSRVAVAGGFFSIGPSVRRRGLAALDAGTGVPLPWRADLDPESKATAMTTAGDALYVAGDFKRVGGQQRPGLAAVNLETGTTLPWKPPATMSCSFEVDCALAATLGAVYVADRGDFNEFRVRGRPRSLAAFDASSGTPLPWNPAPDGVVSALQASGSTVYLGGQFKHLRSADRPYLAAVDALSGIPSDWRPAPDAQATALAVEGTTLYLAGDFTHIGITARRHLAAFDTTTGQLLPWNPGAEANLDHIDELVASGSTVYVSYGNGITALDRLTGQSKPWPGAPGSAWRIAPTATLVYIATGDWSELERQGGLVAVSLP